MIRLCTALFLIHGLIHFVGVAAATGADLPALRQPVSPSMGALWLAAGVLFIAAAVALTRWPHWWWAVGAVAILVSSVAIASAWNDAKMGAVVNGIATVAVVFGFLAFGPVSLRAAYEHDVDRAMANRGGHAPVTDRDLAPLPRPVQRYLRASGVVGHPRVTTVRVRMHGRIRSAPDAPWMPFTAEQYNRFDRPTRLFYLNATRAFVPIQGYHRYVGDEATMHVKAAALLPVAEAAGPDITRAETVTLFNDMCLFAPATLIDQSIQWEAVDDRTARATFTNAGHTVRAELTFNNAGELADFRSGDRGRLGTDGKTMTPTRWSTPVAAYRTFGSYRRRGPSNRLVRCWRSAAPACSILPEGQSGF